MSAPLSSSDIKPLAFDAPRFEPLTVRGDGPANRALTELALALSHDGDLGVGPKWSPAQTLRFIVLSCGSFWLAAAALYLTIH